MSYDQWDTFADYIPQIKSPEPEPVYSPPAQTIFYDGHVSPHSVVNPTTPQSIPPWDEATKELRIVLHRHPVTPAFMQDALKTARKTRGLIKTVAVFVQRGMGDSQSVTVLRSMNFTKDEARGTGQGVCYTRDMRKQEPKPKPKVEPQPEPKELSWSERELKITTDAIEARRAIGVHETFLTGLLNEQAEQQKMIDNQNSVKDTEEWKELCRQERELQEQIDALKRGTCQP